LDDGDEGAGVERFARFCIPSFTEDPWRELPMPGGGAGRGGQQRQQQQQQQQQQAAKGGGDRKTE
jgi:hypothetical protein